MAITLNWVNRNLDAEGVRVYRATAPFAKTALPAPLATIGPGISTYVDETAVRGTLYYYRFGVFKGSAEVISAQRAIAAIPETGPGRATPLFGDWDRGFFGFLTADEMFTHIELSTLVGFTAGTVLSDVPWLKYAHKGKVLFTPQGAVRHGVTWEQIYQAGLVYGVDGPGPNPSPAGSPVNQLKKVVKGDREFIVRLFNGGNDPAALMVSATEDNSLSEFSRLLHPTGLPIVGVSRDHPAWADVSITMLLSGQSSQYGRENWVQELGVSTSTRRTRGASNKIETSNSRTPTTVDTYLGWRPVLELIV